MSAKKKTVKKIEQKAATSMTDLRDKSLDELQKLLATARTDLLELQKSLRANELANPHAVTKMKKEIARIMTVISEVNNSDKKASEAKPSTNSRAERSKAPRTGAGEVKK